MNEEEEKRAKIVHKLKHKMPVTVRWGLMLGLFVGMVHYPLKKRPIYLITHPLIGMVIIGFGLCYNDFSAYSSSYFKWEY